MSVVNPVSTQTSSYQGPAERIPSQTLGQDDFLKLLVTQLTTQDPLSPKQDTDFFSEMATFSALEQTKELQAEVTRLREDQQILNATSLLGRTVEIQLDESTRTSGLVSSVQVVAGTPLLVVGDTAYHLSEIAAIAPAELS